MIPMSLADIASAVGGRLTGTDDPDQRVTGPVAHDSREITAGGLFIAFAGENADGHDFADSAFESGAVAVMGSRPVDGPTIVVDDVLVAYGRLARAVVDRLPGLTVIGITGSSGKTSTKDMIAQLCERIGSTVAPEGSLNNELGMPYTVCKADESTRYLVLEMGARGLGHIKYLCDIAPVDLAVVLNVGTAHLGEFGSVEAIGIAKAELPQAVPAGGAVVLNADDPVVSAMGDDLPATVVRFSTEEAPGAQVGASHLTAVNGRFSFVLTTPQGQSEVELRVHGAHQVANALATASVGHQLGMTAADIAAALDTVETRSSRRMDVFTRESDGIVVIDDTYNANPSSMAAALRGLADIGQGRRKIAVLGYMAELGEAERAAHEEVGRLTSEAGAELVIVVAPEAEGIAVGAAACGVSVERAADQDQAIRLIDELSRPGDTVLVKASRYRTWRVADYLRSTQTLTKEARA
ncbi:UDP-N-acetylmuramoyl-tripeptide--D-alanyl-D-alanine ligase [Stackebrandtia endophytica]|uniref:UDP-N-acetylmuramoyl-tripeptide--D-alanyl-D-alanine ligase n=1 Tax=Stackebrandtia endophytica TaxID=1496996 RepID=A0A543B356_9ACTN|nr:UDP-N-acetylmuramoyl-tripeptide--D-alanyl-D-alanine ligase [Stackebrandtia endophytica]